MSIKKFFTGFAAVALTVAVIGSGVSAATVEELQAQIASLLSQITALQVQLSGQSAATPAAYNFSTDLTVGSKGDAVTSLQSFLESKAMLTMPTGVAKGYFGNLTKAALAKYQASVGISPAAGYFGPKTRAYVNSLAAVPTTGGTTPTVPTSGLTLTLASDNPAAAAIPKGAAGVTLLKFNVSGSGTLDALTFKRIGIGATADFSSAGLYIYDGDTRLTSGRSINSTTHEVSFLNLALKVEGTKTFKLVGDISSSATASNRNAFGLISAVGTPTPTGSLAGNELSIAGQQVGGITATSGAAPTNPKVGQKEALLAEFKLTASSTEDVSVMRVALTEGGSIANSNLSNFTLKQGGNVVATASAVGAKDLVVFNFTAPFLLEKGQERTFSIYGDISGTTRSDDTIVFYFDSKSDVYAIGKTYGYPVDPTITGMDTTGEADTLTVQGGEITITFNGPLSGDIVTRAQDATLYDFTIAAKNSVEIRNLRFNVSTTGAIAIYNDFKVWDATANKVLTSATDVTTAASTDKTFTDTINIAAGESKRMKVTADVDSTDSTSGTVKVHLLAFQANDIRNLDNNTYVATSVIVPNSTVSGNTQTVKAATLDLQLSASPTSQTYVQGTQGVTLAGLSFRAIADDIKLSSVKITASSTTGTLTSGEVQSLGLYDGSTLLGSTKSLDTTALTATFDNLNYTIKKGETKTFTLKGNISSDATDTDVYYFYVAAVTSSNIVAYDKDGNSATLSGTAANSGFTVKHTVTTTGSVTVAVAPDDVESEAGIVIAGTESILAKFRFTAANEQMTVNKLQLLVVETSSATATSTASSDEVPTVKLYDGSTQIGATAGYTVQASGDNSGIVVIENLGWNITKDGSKTLTVKGNLNTISGGADTGSSVYVSVHASNFEAQGASAKDTTITAATGNQKVVYKTKPTIAAPTAASSKLTVGQIPVMKFKIKADGPEQVAFKQIQFKVSMTGATMSAVDAVPATTGNVTLKDVSAGSNLNIASAFSSTSTTTGAQTTITGGATGYVSLLLNSEQVISAGAEKEYELQLTFADVSGTVGAASVIASIHRSETSLVSATTVSGVRSSLGTATDAAPSFVWSDYSVTSHSESTADWANGVLVKIMPSSLITISN
ncbi:MAG: hypothetical protein AAB504_02520 [Patescibacteria group bacterium]